MKFTQDMIKAAIAKGYTPILKKRSVLQYKCPKCGEVRLIKFSPANNKKKRVHACICGFRKGF